MVVDGLAQGSAQRGALPLTHAQQLSGCSQRHTAAIILHPRRRSRKSNKKGWPLKNYQKKKPSK